MISSAVSVPSPPMRASSSRSSAVARKSFCPGGFFRAIGDDSIRFLREFQRVEDIFAFIRADCHCPPFVSNVTHLSLPLLLTTRESRYSHLVTTVTHRS